MPLLPIPLVGGFSRGYPVPFTLAFRRCSILTSHHTQRLTRPRCEGPPTSLSSLHTATTLNIAKGWSWCRATANEHTAEAPVYRGLMNLAYSGLDGRTGGCPRTSGRPHFQESCVPDLPQEGGKSRGALRPRITSTTADTQCSFNTSVRHILHTPEKGRGGVVVRLLASHQGEPGSIPDGVSLPDFRIRDLCLTMTLVGLFSRGSSVSPTLAFRHYPTLISLHPHQLSRLKRFGWLKNTELLRADEGEVRCVRSSPGMQEQGEAGDPSENRPTCGIVRHDSHVRTSGSDPAESQTLFARDRLIAVVSCRWAPCTKYNGVHSCTHIGVANRTSLAGDVFGLVSVAHVYDGASVAIHYLVTHTFITRYYYAVVSYSAPTETAPRRVSFRLLPVSPPLPEQTRDWDSHESARATRRRRARTQLTSLSSGPLLASHQGNPGSIPGQVHSDFGKWESCRTTPLVGRCSRGSPVSLALAFRRRSILTSLDPHLDLDVKRFDCSPPTNADRVQSPDGQPPDIGAWESCRTMLLVGGFSRGSPVYPRTLHSGPSPF
ncbi:hypothetical protein PR048_022750 [Dryococelus australis]|uniref:Uncharacterized protein n=1 Tax=Dryococelus australis TaxID=614101 RepID=A0ABQ9GS90_9NEOP|nr:hypothetical protein PR048_022750 [Dryococelus australis]